jgi:hypothetical protein
MTKRKTKPDDPEQAKRFAQTVRELEAAGDLNPTDAEGAFDHAFRKIVPAKRGHGPAEDG